MHSNSGTMKQMMSGTMYKQGTIVLVPLPFTDLSAQKRRPAVDISPGWFNNSYDDVVLSAITSVIPDNLSDQEDIICEISYEDLEIGTISAKSIVKIPKIFTCEQNIIEKEVAQLKRAKITEVLEKLKKFFTG